MILDIMDVDKFVATNYLQEVTSNLYFDDAGNPDPDGLLSIRIFGPPGSPERKLRMAYIDLKHQYLHPHVYTILTQMDKKMGSLISGSKYFKFDDKTKFFVEASDDDPASGTGLDFLYLHWDNLFFKRTGSMKRENRLHMLSLLKKNEVFITKQVIIPAFFRDMTGNRDKINPINTLYKQLFNGVSVLKTLGTTNFTYNLSRAGVQLTINKIFDYFMDLLKLKEGFLQASVMSKSIDYGVRTLITAPTFSANSWKDMPADYEHIAVPLVQCISEFTIAIITWIEQWVNSIVQGRVNMYIWDTAEQKAVLKNLSEDWKSDFSSEAIEKKIYEFAMTPEMRFYPVTIKFENEERKPFAFISDNKDLVMESGTIDPEKMKKIRYYTWTDVFFLAAMECAADMAIYTTRYPVTTHHSQYFAKCRVRSTFRTMEMLIGGTKYTNYPVVDITAPTDTIESMFIDSLELFPPYIGTLGADHDGDQVCCRGLYSYEANKWVDQYVSSPANAIGMDGGSVRTSGDVGTHTLYNLLRNPD